MVRIRRGATKLGCLVTLLLVAAVGYFGLGVGEAYFRYAKYKDAMRQEIRFRSQLPYDQIKAHMKLAADSLGLPAEAGIVTVRKDGKNILIEAHYDETIDMPGFKRDIHFEPRAVGTY